MQYLSHAQRNSCVDVMPAVVLNAILCWDGVDVGPPGNRLTRFTGIEHTDNTVPADIANNIEPQFSQQGCNFAGSALLFAA